MYCQSDLSLFPQHLNYAWLPSEINKIVHGVTSIDEDDALVFFGGGFHSFGYLLERDDEASTENENVWQLYFYSEESTDVFLQTIHLPKTAHLTSSELLERVVSGYDEQIRKNPRAYHGKIKAYLWFNQISEARQACKDMLQTTPDYWWAILLNSFLLAQEVSFDTAENFLIQWVEEDENFFRYLDLAYFYHLKDKPRKAAEAIIKATEFDADTSWGDGGNSEYRGYTAAMCAYRAGDYDAAIKLCNHLLPVTINGDYAKEGLFRLKTAAEKAKQGEIVDVVWNGNIKPFDAFNNIDIEKLLGHNLPRPTPR